MRACIYIVHTCIHVHVHDSHGMRYIVLIDIHVHVLSFCLALYFKVTMYSILLELKYMYVKVNF